MKKKCNECKRDFSENLITTQHTFENGKRAAVEICPICALENDGTGRTEFTGTMAEALRQEALKEVEVMRREKKNG